MSNTTLLPCPFCGGEALLREIEWPEEGKKIYDVKCADCDMTIAEHGTEKRAIDAWNGRTPKIVRCGECERFHRHTQIDTEHGGCYPPGNILSVRTVHQNDFCSNWKRREVQP
jgi:Lar family restriction alleviation protein